MRKIFLVEDNEAIREVLEIFLSSENLEVQSFRNVKDFASRDLNMKPHLYLFDVMLPDGSGIDLCNEIKGGIDIDIPVIIMSAHAQLHSLKDVCQPNEFISKPFDIDHLLVRINKIIG